MAERPTRKVRPEQSALDRHLLVMGARRPDASEIAGLRRLVRDPQYRRAVEYLMAELSGVGRVPFTGENTQGASFRSGSLAVGIAIAMIAEAVIMRFPAEEPTREG